MDHNNTRRQKLAKLVKAQNTVKEKIEKTLDAWNVVEKLTGTVDAPLDWSSEHDHYLYGTPKLFINNLTNPE
ncbi:hypothetical protein [Chroococcus sp. FPU101]|uniref:hypothetical protein n=1 Tax=Chroococcus sp. FPU101 TaxID=1974212 RepID=UPI001A8F2E2D|nr:hypothetical protein [Chroococcus sp. FPU101]GFE69750.1 hypothetical protein CFPU101_23600 [Chroococcus sp. FPU101]